MISCSELRIIHQDRSLVVVDKPGGLLAVPGRGPGGRDCVVARLGEIFTDLPRQPAVHRLDLQTSGLMVLARTARAHRYLSRQFQQRQVKKRYIAMVAGAPRRRAGTIALSFRLDPENRPRQIWDPVRGKLGITRWRVLSDESAGSRLEFMPITGRTHQLRLHAAHPRGLGLPIIGDYLYGSGRDGERMLLHAGQLSFVHPEHGTRCSFDSQPRF